ncbi:hypothetical protein V1477_020255 [Vespula maculifrons]|uniref:Uncharacterized protein n=1 Tax=Vespula maculifrons TaxID=7453 RepID=A0ABD2ANL0_VESMC
MDTASRRPCFFPVVRFKYDANGIYLSSGSHESEPRSSSKIRQKRKDKEKKTMQRKGCSGKNKRREERFEEEENAFD